MRSYRVTRTIQYTMGTGRSGSLVLQEGDVVQAATIRQAPPSQVKHYERAEARHRQDSPGTRLAYFKAEGVIRYAVAMADLIPTTQPPTIPVEATSE